jgi:transposase
VIKEGEQSIANTGTPKFSTPRKKRPRKAPVTDIPEYQCCNIRQIIYDFHKTEGCRVTVKNLQQKIKDDLGIVASETSLRRILKKMGFKWRKTENNRKILIEKMEIRALRIYRNKIQYFRTQQRPIVLYYRSAQCM